MGEAAKRQPIDLDEFERRLRAPAAPQDAGPEDPLAELARLVGGGPDPFAPIFAAGRADARSAAKAPVRAEPDAWDRLAAAPQSQPAFDPTRDLRGALEGRSGLEAAAPRPPAFEGRGAGQADPPLYAAETTEGWDGEPAAGRDWSKRKRSPTSMYMMGTALLLVVAGIGGTLALRGHVERSGPPPTILASTNPVKVKPPKTAPMNDPIAQSSAFLNEPDSATVAPAHVVNSEEEPIDLSQAVGSSAAPDGSQPDNSFFPKPHRVKTVMVRPDGSIISDGAPDTASSPAPAADVVAPAPVASSAPSAPPPAPAAVPPKSAPSPSPRPDEARTAVSQPSPFKSVARIAAAAPDTRADLESPASSAEPVRSASSPKQRVAEAEIATPAVAAAGDWAVQLAAPATELGARAEVRRFGEKYARELGGRSLSYHAALARGRTVWRVRVAGLAEPAALELCNEIKSDGGACFVARN